MESFLSLPRSAKAGLAVLLAVALLGWGIVAYSSKRQHEDAKSLQQALATLDGKTESEQTVTAELESLRARLETAEADLSATMNEKTALEDQIGQLETDLGEKETAVTDLEESLAARKADGDASTGTNQALGLVGDQGSDVDVATLRERLTNARTALSARSATLAQRDRELERTRADLEVANADIAALQSDLVEQGVLRERLSTTMTTLSGRTATLAQRDRELERLKVDYEQATAKIAALEADLVEQGVLRDRLNATMTKLSGQSAMLAQRDRALASLGEDHEATLSKLADFEADVVRREETDQTLSSLQLKVDRAEQALKNGADALAVNQQEIADSEARLADLQTEAKTIEQAIEDKKQLAAKREQKLVELSDKIAAKEQKLTELVATLEERKGEIDEAKDLLADLKMAEAKAEADIAGLAAEFEQQEAALSDKEDAVVYTDTRLAKLKDEVAMTEERIAETEILLGQKTNELNNRQQDVKAVEATLSALKKDRATTATEAIELRNTIGDQEAVLRDLESAKGDLEKTNIELSYQKKILSERQEQIQMAEERLEQLQQARREGSSRDQTFARIPIAAISSDNLAVLPVDPIYEPFPVQTPMGVRLTEVHFDMGSAELTPGGMRKAKEAAAWIKTQDVEKIRLVGFTDTIGTRANNQSLAKRRATSLLRVFEEQGLDTNRIEIVARGEVGAREVTEDQTAEPLNRCVGVFIGAGG